VESAYVTRSSSFIEYIKLHLISLEQDLVSAVKGQGYTEEHVRGQIEATRHLLSVALDIMATSERI
jgi:hypothetical protein